MCLKVVAQQKSEDEADKGHTYHGAEPEWLRTEDSM